MWRGLAGAFVCVCVLLWTLPPWARAQEAPAAAADGTISGKVLDKGTGEPLIDAGVEVVGTNKRARTDLDGKYSLKVPPGTYAVRMFAAEYQSVRLDDVHVVAGQKATADAILAPAGKNAGEVVEVVAKADKQAESIQLLERKNSAVVSDNIGAQTIKESPDSNAAEVVERVPAVTIRDGKYVYVRGLGPRYTGALLNGSKLPSTDPNKRVIPLDIFPAEFIESISVTKSYTPNLPGDDPGGFVDIKLREPPEKLSYTIGMSTSADTATTFSGFQTYSGTSGDLMSFGAGSRSLPGIIPDRSIDSCPSCATGQTPASQQRAYAGSFNNVWTPHNITAPPNFGFNASVGDTFGPLGVSLAGIWNVDYQTHTDQIANEFTSGGLHDPLQPTQLFTYTKSTQTAQLGGVLTSSYTIDPNNRVNFRALENHVGQDNVYEGSGFDFNATTDPQNLSQNTLYYQEQNLGYGQLEGEHHFEPIDINWRSALSQTTLNAPDSRFLTRDIYGNFYPNSDSALRTFLDVGEWLTDSAVDFTVPFRTGLPGTDVWSGLPAKLQFGPAYTYRDRNLTYRRFRFNQANGIPGFDTSGPAETFLIPENVGQTPPGDFREFNFLEDTRPSDQFDASQQIAAMYGLIDTPIIPDQLRLIAGVRLEYSYIAVNGADSSDSHALHTRLSDLNPLPGINLVYNPRPDMNVRLGYSITVSRPEFRELTPTEFVEPLGFRSTIGNPFLVQSTVNAVDLRWEWFMSPLELLSFGVFYKGMDKPIEQTVIARSSSVADSWLNAESANLYGFEFEARKNFDLLTEPAREYLGDGVANQMRNFSLLTNVAYVYSNVLTGANKACVPGTAACADLQAESNRPLQGQAPYAVNATLEYDLPDVLNARLLYNISGTYIQAVGTKLGNTQLQPLPSIDQQPRNELDFVVTGVIKPFDVPLNAKFAVENMLNAAYVQTQGPELVGRFRNGVQFGFSLSYSY